MESPTEAGPLLPTLGYTSLMGSDPCSPTLQTLRKIGLPAGSPATWPLAQVPQVSGLFLPSLPGYHAVPVAGPKRERDICYPPGVLGPKGAMLRFRESTQHSRIRPRSGLVVSSHFSTCEVGLAPAGF